MNNFQALNLHNGDQLAADVAKARGVIGIDIHLSKIDGAVLTIDVTQAHAINGVLLTQRELVQRAKTIVGGYLGAYKCHYRPHVLSIDFDSVDAKWVTDRMNLYSLKNKDLVRQLGIDTAQVSDLLSGRRNFTKFHKALFWHYFNSFRLKAGLLQ